MYRPMLVYFIMLIYLNIYITRVILQYFHNVKNKSLTVQVNDFRKSPAWVTVRKVEQVSDAAQGPFFLRTLLVFILCTSLPYI